MTETRGGGDAAFYLEVVNCEAGRQSARITFQDVTRIDPTAVETVITGSHCSSHPVHASLM